MSTRAASVAVPGGRLRRELVIAAMLISSFMAAIEVTVISTAMPTIVARLGGFSLFSWAFGAYLLTQAVVTPIYGRCADSFGRKPVYLASAALFLAGSLLCGCAWSMPSLILFRAMQGIGGGGLVPLATTIIGDVSEPADRPRMMGYVSGIWGISAILGPLLGAFLVNSPGGAFGWPFVFWINLPIGLAAMAMVVRYLHEPPRTGRHRPIDIPGAGLLIVGIGLVMLVLVQAQTLAAARIVGLLGAGVLALLAFAWRERRLDDPLLPAHLLRRRTILAATLSAALCGGVMLGITASLPTWGAGCRRRQCLVGRDRPRGAVRLLDLDHHAAEPATGPAAGPPRRHRGLGRAARGQLRIAGHRRRAQPAVARPVLLRARRRAFHQQPGLHHRGAVRCRPRRPRPGDGAVLFQPPDRPGARRYRVRRPAEPRPVSPCSR